MSQDGWESVTELFEAPLAAPKQRKIGIEIERIGIWDDGYALHYREGKSPSGEARPGAGRLLDDLAKRHQGWKPTANEQGQILGFSTPEGKVSLEPGSQLEFSSVATNDVLSQIKLAEKFEADVDAVGKPWGLRWIGLGVNPATGVEAMDVIPSPRYAIMTEFLGGRARLGTSMMRLTSSVQINLDYGSEAEAMDMLRTALLAAPVSYALFGNSPFLHGKEAGTLSYRSAIWRETDPDRTGLLPEVFADGFGFADYAKLTWHRPLMFAQDERHRYVAARGASLADIAKGAVPGVEARGENALNGVRQLFTEARLKPGYVEVRSIDGLRPDDRYASIAFWVGLLYGAEARALTKRLLGALTAPERDALWTAAGREGLKARAPRVDIAAVAAELVAASRAALLERRFGEEKLLAPIERTLREGKNPADRLIERFRGEWRGSLAPVLRYAAGEE